MEAEIPSFLEGEIGVGPNRKTLSDFFECTREEKIDKVYSSRREEGICDLERLDLL